MICWYFFLLWLARAKRNQNTEHQTPGQQNPTMKQNWVLKWFRNYKQIISFWTSNGWRRWRFQTVHRRSAEPFTSWGTADMSPPHGRTVPPKLRIWQQLLHDGPLPLLLGNAGVIEVHRTVNHRANLIRGGAAKTPWPTSSENVCSSTGSKTFWTMPSPTQVPTLLGAPD